MTNKGRKKSLLTPREEEVMQMLWTWGPQFVRELLERYPDPRPHFNTVSTVIRNLEDKGFVDHEVVAGSLSCRARQRGVPRPFARTDRERIFQQQLSRSCVDSCRRRENLS